MKINTGQKVCSRCVMDTTAEGIYFDDDGVCNFCKEMIERSGSIIYQSLDDKNRILGEIVKKIKLEGKGKPYDCIVGVSGGVDSSWVLVQAVKMGLRPLAVHMDNGWNTELATNNIANLIKELGVDLFTHVIDWEEYRELMQCFLKANVVDVELLYDNAMFAVNYFAAAKYGIKYILGGMNATSEGMRIPDNWHWSKFDKKNIKSIVNSFSNIKITTYPTIGTLQYIYYTYMLQIKWVNILNFMEYEKYHAISVLREDFQYKPYPYKHYESVFTRFYQGYILPRKFAIDKRKMHFSSLIISGQLDRNEALNDLKRIPYPTERDMDSDVKYFLKKMNWTQMELDNYIERPPTSHSKYGSEKFLWDLLLRLYRKIRSSRK
jgi:N-acetyl sugar amidotransferase